MYKKIASLWLVCLFLSGSVILPLGDFSLLGDLPCMYQHYTKIVKEEPSLVDFIGDYLLGGKYFLGHNKNDIPQKPNTAVQFQHQANALSIILCHFKIHDLIVIVIQTRCPIRKILIKTSDYNYELFRPPLT